MSAYTKIQIEADGLPASGEKPTECFFCGESLFGSKRDTGGFVHWRGSTGDINLHQICAEVLGVNLIQDARSLSTRTGKRVKMSVPRAEDVSGTWFGPEKPDKS